jgi:hypothetical protein
VGPDGLTHKAHTTFDTKSDAETRLATVRTDIVRDTWNPNGRASRQPTTFGTYAERWLAARSLEARTGSHYRRLLERQLLPQLEDVPLRHITPDLVREWHATTALDTPTLRSHAYGLLRTILGQAVRDELIRSNPSIRGGGNAKRVKKIKPATLAELEAVVGALPGALSRHGPPGLVVRPPVRGAGRAAAGRREHQVRNHPRSPRSRPRRWEDPRQEAEERRRGPGRGHSPHTYSPSSANTCAHTRRRARTDCCSRRAAEVTWHRPACTECSTGRGRPLVGLTFGFTTYATPAPSWPPKRAPRSPT